MGAPPETATGTGPARTVVIDCPPGSPAPSMRLCGMTLVERLVRDARRAGAGRVLVRATDEQVAGLDPAALGFERLGPGQTPRSSDQEHVHEQVHEQVRGDALLGVVVTDERTRRAAEWALLQTCRRPHDGPGDRFFIRTFSLRITRLLARTPVTPTQVTYLNAAVGVAACLLAAAGGRWGLAGAGIGFIASVVLDSVDGELARVRHMTSRHGMIVDNVSDDVVDNGFVLGLGVGLGGGWLWLGLAAAAARWLVAARTYVEVAAAGRPGDVMAFRWWFERGEAATEVYADYRSPLTWLRSLGRRDTYCLVFGALCLAGWGIPALLLGVAISGSYFAMLFMHLLLRDRGR